MTLSKFDMFFAVRNGYYVGDDHFKAKNKETQNIANAITSGWSALRQLEEFQNLQRADETITPGLRKLRVAEFARKQKANVVDELLALQTNTIDQISELEDKRAEAYKPNNQALETRRAGIRHELSNMDRQERDNRIRQAIQNNDQDTIGAIAVQPFNNSVCAQFQHTECQNLFNQEVLGTDDHNQLSDLKRGLERLEHTAVHFDRDMESNFILPAQEVEQKQSAAAQAFYGVSYAE